MKFDRFHCLFRKYATCLYAMSLMLERRKWHRETIRLLHRGMLAQAGYAIERAEANAVEIRHLLKNAPTALGTRGGRVARL